MRSVYVAKPDVDQMAHGNGYMLEWALTPAHGSAGSTGNYAFFVC